MTTKIVILAAVVVVLLATTTTMAAASSPAGSLATQCADKLQNVMPCLSFANGKAATPTKQCCDSVESMKESNPACLCFVIQQIHNGTNPELKSMGISEARLLQLPSACKIANASISDCPKLLNLPANSPDAAIFTSNNTSPSTTGSTTTPSGTALPQSNGFKNGVPQFGGSILVAALAVFFFYAFPSGRFTSTSS